ncbi:LA_2272/LA_2273 family lipoprotein [Leptospira adleri]|uniref:DUF5723 domain-containing protein n=1 Tax=Leptospira adleri TaxID=2023186 RepID=A0ABX4P1J1_9LEPT|nr:hypothetical protein [Leptospira adleri]PJZ62844.1 hypothetical protein CH376_05920 [Leptospira adleri]
MTRFYILILLHLLSSNLIAETITPLQVALFNPIQLTEEESDVFGLRLNFIYGKNRNLYGLDLGLVNSVAENSGGLALGMVNYSGSHSGLQTGVVNLSKRRLYGIQFGIANYCDSPFGLQLGLVNVGNEAYLPMLGIFTNVARKPYLGQFTVGFNQARESFFQVGGILNNSNEGLIQLAGGLNFSENSILQISGLSNLSENGVFQLTLGVNRGADTKSQFAGLLNISGNSLLQMAFIGNSILSEGFLQFALLGNHARKNQIQIAVLGNYAQSSYLQFSSLLNINTCPDGCKANAQISTFLNYSDQVNSQFGLINIANQSNLQIGILNLSDSSKKGQAGIFNRSPKTEGFMIGLINESHELFGYQIGLINIAKNAFFPFTLFFNSNYENRNVKRNTGLLEGRYSLFQLSLYSPLQFFTYETPINGVRLNLFYGKSVSIFGLDLGLFNLASEVRGVEIGAFNLIRKDFGGVQIGLFNSLVEDFYGMQIGALGHYNRKSLYGFSISPIAVTKGNVYGMQIGLLLNSGQNFPLPQFSFGFNIANFSAGQIGGIGNYASNNVKGAQISTGFNYAKGNVYGQIAGIFNYAEGNVVPGQISLFFNRALYTPFQLSLFGNHAVEESDIQLAGLFNIVARDIRSAPFGRGADPYAQVSLVFNLSRKTYFQASAFNIDRGHNYVQIGGINFARDGHFQAGGINISVGMQGVQTGPINFADDGAGTQIGMVNISNRFEGVSVGAWNLSHSFKGLSVGIFNFAEYLTGAQVGLINIHLRGKIPVMVGVNAGATGED